MSCGSFTRIQNILMQKFFVKTSLVMRMVVTSILYFSHIYHKGFSATFFISFSRQNEALCFAIDELAPEVIDKVKYVLHGDFSQLQDLKTQSQEWAQKV